MIKITCTGSDSLPLDSIEEFQGNLKKRTKADIEKIIKSIQKYGFSFPFFIWNGTGHNYCLDGHGRILALSQMRQQGEDIPLLPVVYIEAEDEAEAKNKLLRMNSQYGSMTANSVMEFIDGIHIDLDELCLPEGGKMSFDWGPIDLDFQDNDKTIDDYLDHFDMTLTFDLIYKVPIKQLENKIGKKGIVEKIIAIAEEEI